MYTVLYRLNDGIVEEIEQHDYEWIFENVFDDKDYKTVNDLPEYNPYRQYLRVVDDNITVEDKELSPEKIAEIEKKEARDEIKTLKRWFDFYYTQHEQKYRRLIALGDLTDDGNNPEDVLMDLYREAEINRKTIQDLEKII